MPDALSDELANDPRVRELLEAQGPRPPDPPLSERLARAGQEFFMPISAARNPDTPEARQAYAEAIARAHAAGGGKVPGMPGAPVFENAGTGLGLDVAGNLLWKGGGALGGALGKGVLASKFLGADPMALGMIGGALHPSWISQRLPVGAKALEDPLANPLMMDVAAMKASPKQPQQKQSLWDKNVGLTHGYPNMVAADKAASTDQHASYFMNHVVDNLKWLYNQVPEDIRGRSKLWYEGANRMAQGAADHFKLPLQSVAGVYAALSPRKDWFMNVSLGDRMMYMWTKHQNTPWSDEMTLKALDPQTGIYAGPDFAAQMQNIYGKTYAQLQEPLEKAMWMRIYDEAHHDPRFLVITPEGDRLGPTLRKDKQEKVIVWAGREAISKAIQVMESNGDRGVISNMMGEKNKVRNFYMNILDPHSPTLDVTIDTHAVAAGLLRPLGLSNLEVMHNFGDAAAGSDITGARGLYGLYAEAYRRAALDLGISPRELQSITWEAVRGLYPEEFKTKANQDAINALWQSQAQGVSVDDIRRQILEYAAANKKSRRAIDPPDWHGQPPGGLDPAGWYGYLP